ncbi:MAG: hypothetical protein WBC82_11380 [Dehalococcoidia bacterium]
MTRGSVREYTKALRGLYLSASKKEKGRILDEFTKVVGCHRKAAIHLLYRGKPPQSVNRQGHHLRYSPEVAEALAA